ncbi:cobyric acid synthase CobQ [Cytophagaceae bacterium YF14B1]|uniref:Cobyric acid synthase CobQ n=1 Tax=Xanthocytophaga flava TaxID=3048013 RepID=A0AAE3QV19_9BACT|nr:cobyric acid synthase CobQ [Xanthocytophaga flavus]MDJ1485947.1 cobyric acid synthase CobQ [Xanthocytophaga flavus]
MSSKITYYPVDNGDQSLISVEEDNYTTNILVDCRIRETSKGSTDPTQYDVKADLLRTLRKRRINDVEGATYVDIFTLSHGDDDHLHGFESNFYQGDPKNYKKKNKDDGEIFIDVLWFSPMVMGTATNDDERCFNKEAKRRIKLHRDKSADKDLPGNRIVIIGYDANEDLDGLNLVRKVPGQIITRFNDRDLKTFSIFIHGPYQQHLSDEEVDKNRVSVVFQARFKATATSAGFCTLAMFGGDADHHAWKFILEKTKQKGNDVKQQALSWDLFLAPHHCSWTFFNDCPQDKNPTPVATSLKVLDYKRGVAKVIASCKEILNNDDNPPHYKAKEQYVKKVNGENFLNTATAIKSGKTPQPIIFEITAQGPMRAKKTEGSASVAGGSALGVINQPSGYGSK